MSYNAYPGRDRDNFEGNWFEDGKQSSRLSTAFPPLCIVFLTMVLPLWLILSFAAGKFDRKETPEEIEACARYHRDKNNKAYDDEKKNSLIKKTMSDKALVEKYLTETVTEKTPLIEETFDEKSFEKTFDEKD